jgi:hypothetical protein
VVQAAVDAVGRAGTASAATVGDAVEGAGRSLTRRMVGDALAAPRAVADRDALARALAERPATPALGGATAAALGLRSLVDDDRLAGFWLHLDADVLDDAVMPAVDYRLPGGLSPTELGEVLRVLLASGRAVGMEITIYNPRLDPDGAAGRTLVSAVLDGFAGPR